MSASLAAFTPAAALRAPRAAPRRAVPSAVRAEAPSRSRNLARSPKLDGRRAVLGAAVSAAMSFARDARSRGCEGRQERRVLDLAQGRRDGGAVVHRAHGGQGLRARARVGGTPGGHGPPPHRGGRRRLAEKGVAIPFDATHLHFGKAQKEASIELEPGTHTLTLQFANAKHESFGKKFAKTITVNVV